MQDSSPRTTRHVSSHWLLDDDPLWRMSLEALRHDIYHEPAYVAAEARRLGGQAEAFLHREGGALFFLPYVARCAVLPDLRHLGPVLDVVSPYGYPGAIVDRDNTDGGFAARALDRFLAGLRARGAVSAFLRNDPCLDGFALAGASPDVAEHAWPTVIVPLRDPVETLWSQVPRKRRQQITKAQRSGATVRRVPLADGAPTLLEIYDETMDRVGAGSAYRFDRGYLRALQPLADRLDVWLVDVDGQAVAATLTSSCDGIVQTLLGGTRRSALALSPDSLLTWEIIAWARGAGAEMVHLGGGVGGADDGVLRFKADFSDGRGLFRTFRVVLDRSRYAELVAARATRLRLPVQALQRETFFPTYRVSAPRAPALVDSR